MKRIVAAFLIVSCIFALFSCAKVEKYHDSPEAVYLVSPFVDPVEWRNYRYVTKELATIQLTETSVLWVAVCLAYEDSVYHETIIVKEMKFDNEKYTFGNFTKSFEPNNLSSQKQFDGKEMLSEDVGEKTLVFDVWNTEKIGERSPDYNYKDFNVKTELTSCNFTLIYKLVEK